jgi:hypothetical protein
MRAALRVVSLVLAVLSGAVNLSAQSFPNLKPDIGDKFICQIQESCNCGDWKCEGMDTISFEITEVSSTIDSLHTNVVVASTKALGLHMASYVWGGMGWDVNPVSHTYPDSTLLSFEPKNVIQTTFRAGASADWSALWASKIPFERDTTILFQGSTINGSKSTNMTAIYLPSIGWFFSLAGGQGDKNICCPGMAGYERWSMSLIGAIKIHSTVATTSKSELGLMISDGLLTLSSKAVSSGTCSIGLLDPLGRPVHSWQMPVEAGERRITLNVADVPSGVCFLRVSGGGVDEVKRVAIIH